MSDPSFAPLKPLAEFPHSGVKSARDSYMWRTVRGSISRGAEICVPVSCLISRDDNRLTVLRYINGLSFFILGYLSLLFKNLDFCTLPNCCRKQENEH